MFQYPTGFSTYIYPLYCLNYNLHSVKSKNTEANLKNYLRMLWEQHIAWTRSTIVSMLFDLPDVSFVTNRLLRNPKDFETALKPFYGDKIASKFADLFKEHLLIAAQLVSYSKEGNSAAATNAEKAWYENANEIAAFLASINPYWSEKAWKSMLYEHLKLTKAEAVDMLTKNYASGVNVYDNIEKQALQMADMMTTGIIKQFPYTFIR